MPGLRGVQKIEQRKADGAAHPWGTGRIIGKQVRGLYDSVTVCSERTPRRKTAATGETREGGDA